jgi:AmpE protein
MRFIITFVALLIERFFDWSHLRQWHWYIALQQTVAKHFSGQSTYFLMSASILPVLLAFLVIHFVLNQFLYGVLDVVFQLFILLYCFGPRNLWADAFASTHAAEQTYGFQSAFFIEANRRVFAIIFWYSILGPIGCILYRILDLTAHAEETLPEFVSPARYFVSLLDWLPARVFTFSLALAGHFVNVIQCWRKKNLWRFNHNDTFLTECGTAALGQEGALPLSRSAVSLLDRAFLITLAGLLLILLLV